MCYYLLDLPFIGIFALHKERTYKPGYRIDWDTHQFFSENRESFALQWRATPFGVTFVSVDYKEERALKTFILGVSSHLLPAFLYKGFITHSNVYQTPYIRKVAGVVERGGLEIRYTACCIGGSNPSLSAYTMKRIYPAEGKSSYCFKPMHIINA